MASPQTKNYIIIGLCIVCIILVFLLIGSKSAAVSGVSTTETASVTGFSSSSGSCLSSDSSKKTPAEVLKLASIEEISLATKPADIEAIAKKSGYTCTKNDGGAGNVNWSCNHTKLKGTVLNVVSTGEKISQINRNGNIAPADIPPILDQVEKLKFLLNTREGVRFTQSDNNFSLSVRFQNEGRDQYLDYNIMNRRMRDQEDPTKLVTEQVYSAAIVSN